MCGVFCLLVSGFLLFLAGGGGYIYIYYPEAVFFVNVQCGRHISKDVYFTMVCLLYLRLSVFCES